MSGELGDRLVRLVELRPGLSDRELTDDLLGPGRPQQQVNQAARRLVGRQLLIRRVRADGVIGNFPVAEGELRSVKSARPSPAADGLSEDLVKQHLKRFLTSLGWTSEIAWGHARGVDIDARRGGDRWLIEVKGGGSRSQMRVNYFIGMLGELLQRMDDPHARYSIAVPDLPQYRGLWERFPALAQERTGITMLVVDARGSVVELSQ